MIRLAGIVAIMTGLVMSSGVAGAMNGEVGLTDCHYDGCSVVTLDDLGETTRDTQVAAARNMSFPSGRFDPHFTR